MPPSLPACATHSLGRKRGHCAEKGSVWLKVLRRWSCKKVTYKEWSLRRIWGQCCQRGRRSWTRWRQVREKGRKLRWPPRRGRCSPKGAICFCYDFFCKCIIKMMMKMMQKKSWAKLNWMFAISLFCLMLFLAAFDKKVHGGPRNKTDDDWRWQR